MINGTFIPAALAAAAVDAGEPPPGAREAAEAELDAACPLFVPRAAATDGNGDGAADGMEAAAEEVEADDDDDEDAELDAPDDDAAVEADAASDAASKSTVVPTTRE